MTTARILTAILLTLPCMAIADSCDRATAEQAWTKCSACHSLDTASVGGAGPVLRGLFGRRAGTSPGFVFSTAFRRTNFTWNDANFDVFLSDPQQLVPGTAMAFSGLRNGDARKAIACFIRQSSIQPGAPPAP